VSLTNKPDIPNDPFAIVEYLLIVVPAGHPLRTIYSDDDFASYDIRVEWRGNDLWRVKCGHRVLNLKGELEHEGGLGNMSSSKYDQWMKAHRFTLAKAKTMALKLQPVELLKLETRFAKAISEHEARNTVS
jgi:hypothetical protein